MIRVVFLIFILFSSSYAHRLSVFTNFEDDKLFISSYFANGNPCKNCELKILKDNKLLKKGHTNKKGEFETSIKEKEFLLSVDAGGGHTVLKNIQEVVKPQKRYENSQLQKLEKENKRLKIEVELLEKKLAYMDVFKTIFALIVIVLIFAFLKRVKK